MTRPSAMDPVPDREFLLVASDRFRGRLTAYARVFLGDGSLAEDAVQETLVLASRKWREVHDMEALFPWLRAILRFKCMEMLRRRRRESPTDPAGLARALEARSEPVLDLLADEQDRLQRIEALRECLGQLDGRAREVLRLFYHEDESNADIARSLGLSPGYVRVFLTRIRKKVRDCMEAKLESTPT